MVSSRPVALPTSVRLLNRGDDWLEIEPKAQGVGTEGPDVLVGDLPLPVYEGHRMIVDWMSLPPPLPLRMGDISTMWGRIAELGYPLPNMNIAQGLHSAAAASVTDSPSIGLELLPKAHAAAMSLLTQWPVVESSTSVWRPIDVPGGREDERLTDRLAGRWSAVRRADERLLPGRTARTVPSEASWSSSSLSAAALRARHALDDLGHETGFEVPARRTFDLLARQAWPLRAVADPPLSSWPPVAADTIYMLRALLASLDAAVAGPRRAPLSYVWRLYEAWVAAELGHLLASIPGITTAIPPKSGPGCDWYARYELGRSEFIVAAQARVAATPQSCPPIEDADLHSITSVLRPDLLIASRLAPGESWQVIVFDAKHRIAGQTMDASAVAEAGSKYLWGIRRESLDCGVNRVVIVSTEDTGAMFDSDALIDSVRFLPSG